MPEPEPKEDENRQEFVGRCVSDEQMIDDYPQADQRLGVCYDIYDESRQNSRKFNVTQGVINQVDTTPTKEMADNARKALDAYENEEYSNDQCGTRVGLERANQLANREQLSEETINRMVSFFSRHAGDEAVEGDEKWEDCGYLTWQFWGGDAGRDWAERKQDELENE